MEQTPSHEQDPYDDRVFEINSLKTLAQYLGMVAVAMPEAIVKILGPK